MIRVACSFEFYGYFRRRRRVIIRVKIAGCCMRRSESIVQECPTVLSSVYEPQDVTIESFSLQITYGRLRGGSKSGACARRNGTRKNECLQLPRIALLCVSRGFFLRMWDIERTYSKYGSRYTLKRKTGAVLPQSFPLLVGRRVVIAIAQNSASSRQENPREQFGTPSIRC